MTDMRKAVQKLAAAVRDWITENPDGYNKLKHIDLQPIDNESIKNKI